MLRTTAAVPTQTDCDSLHVDFLSILQIVCGVPQGSTFGPLLLLLHINDLANSSDVLFFRLFADDANIFYATKTSKDLEALERNYACRSMRTRTFSKKTQASS